MGQPLVSVVIPVFNGQAFLRQAIQSVLEQTYRPLEVIVVNDGSTDGSAEVIGEFGDRVIAVDQANMGVAGARNTGMRTARGEFVAFLDQDDWWRSEKVAKQVNRFLADARVGLVHTAVAHWDEQGQAWAGPLDPAARPELLVGSCYRRLLEDNQIYNSSVMIRRALLATVGLCDPAIRGNTVQDYDLWLRLARVSLFDFVPEELTVFRIHGGQGTWDRREMLAAEAGLMERVLRCEPADVRRALRLRMARLYDQLGTSHLDFDEYRLARRQFGRSLRWRLTARAAALWAATWLPGGLIRWLRRSHAKCEHSVALCTMVGER